MERPFYLGFCVPHRSTPPKKRRLKSKPHFINEVECLGVCSPKRHLFLNLTKVIYYKVVFALASSVALWGIIWTTRIFSFLFFLLPQALSHSIVFQTCPLNMRDLTSDFWNSLCPQVLWFHILLLRSLLFLWTWWPISTSEAVIYPCDSRLFSSFWSSWTSSLHSERWPNTQLKFKGKSYWPLLQLLKELKTMIAC